MGKSYRKTPVVKDNKHKGKKEGKKIANKIVRAKLKNNDYNIPNGKSYRKEYCSYKITDFIYRFSEADAIKYYEEHLRPEYYSHCYASRNHCEKVAEDFRNRYPTLESWLSKWKKDFKNK